MEFIYIGTISICVLLYILIISKVKENYANIYLSFFLLAIILGEIALVLRTQDTSSNLIIFWLFVDTLPTLFGPLSYLYIKTSIDSNFRQKSKTKLIHFTPFLLAIGLVNYSYWSNDNSLYLMLFLHVFIKNIISLVYIIITYKYLIDYKNNIKNLFSSIEKIDYKWLRFFILIELMVWLLYLAILPFLIFNIAIPFNPEILINLGISFFIILISVYSIQNTHLFSRVKTQQITIIPEAESTEVILEKKNITKKEITSPLVLEEKYQKLLSYFEENKPFLDENLSLQDLSIALGIHQKSLSTIINQKTNKNFFDFVNSYRVDYFNSQVLLPKNQQYTLLSIAYNAGFGSKSAFNRAYKKKTNKTPTQYLKELKS